MPTCLLPAACFPASCGLPAWGLPARPALIAMCMAPCLGDPTDGWGGALKAIRARWPDPVSATVHLRAPFRAVPRFALQLAECSRRVADFVRRDVRWRLGVDAQVATVGKGVVP